MLSLIFCFCFALHKNNKYKQKLNKGRQLKTKRDFLNKKHGTGNKFAVATVGSICNESYLTLTRIELWDYG